MSDLIERLRGTKLPVDPFPATLWMMCKEAADEIERLQARVDALEGVLSRLNVMAQDPKNVRIIRQSVRRLCLSVLAATEQEGEL